jgi:hypothetical protein
LKKLAFLGGAVGLGIIALLHSPITQAADHGDAASLAANPMADINDVYAWNTADGTKINLAMTVSPFDNGTRMFGPSVQYVFHLTRFTAYPQTGAAHAAGEEYKVICTFASDTAGKCWVVDPTNKVLDYVEGNFSAVTGKDSADGKVKVFAGRRSDPFFFNLAGFVAARTGIETACGGGTAPAECPGTLATAPGVNAAGCPALPASSVAPFRATLGAEIPQAVGPCPANQRDCFLNTNVMAIVLQIDKSLIVDDTKKLVAVWGSSHAAQ